MFAVEVCQVAIKVSHLSRAASLLWQYWLSEALNDVQPNGMADAHFNVNISLLRRLVSDNFPLG